MYASSSEISLLKEFIFLILFEGSINDIAEEYSHFLKFVFTKGIHLDLILHTCILLRK